MQTILRSSHQRCSIKEGVLRNFTKFTGKHLCQSLFFNKVADLRPRPSTLLNKRLWHRCFPVNFVKFLRTPFLQNTSGGCFWILIKTSFWVDVLVADYIVNLYKVATSKQLSFPYGTIIHNIHR